MHCARYIKDTQEGIVIGNKINKDYDESNECGDEGSSGDKLLSAGSSCTSWSISPRTALVNTFTHLKEKETSKIGHSTTDSDSNPHELILYFARSMHYGCNSVIYNLNQ